MSNQNGGGGGGSKAPNRAKTDKKAQVKTMVKAGPQTKGYVVKGKDSDHPSLMFTTHPVANKIAQGEWIVRHQSMNLARGKTLTKEEARKICKIMTVRQYLKRGIAPDAEFTVLKYRFRTDNVVDRFRVHHKLEWSPRNWDPIDLRLLGYSSLKDGSQDHLTYEEADTLRLSLTNKILLKLGKELLPVPNVG